MKTVLRPHPSSPAPPRLPVQSASGGLSASGLAALQARLADAEETIRAIRTGEVDTVMVAGKEGSQVFTLQGAEHAYRVLIESMNEGALTLTADNKMILYANACFARMVKCALEQVIGSSFRRFLSTDDLATLRPLLKRGKKIGDRIHVLLRAGDGSTMPVQISVQPLAAVGDARATIAMVLTDMTEARRSEEILRALTRRVVEVQEAERGRVALELHDHITQLLCAVHFSSQALATSLSSHKGPAKQDAMKLSEMVGQTAEEVERISHNLRPSVLDQLGLVAIIRDTTADFATRTGVLVKLTCTPLMERLPADTELTLYRILQEVLKNVEQHAKAHHVSVALNQPSGFVQLLVKDDGVGFAPYLRSARSKAKNGLGLLSMRERATYVGGTLTIKSVRGAGTEVEVLIPLAPVLVAAS